MRIDTLTLKNFNGFETRQLTFDPHFNLLVGDNASGKTTILDALYVAIGSWFLGMRGGARPSSIGEDYVRLITRRYLDSYSFEKQFPCEVKATGLVMGESASWTRTLNGENGRTTSLAAKAISDLGKEADDRLRADGEVVLPLICTFGTERLWFESSHRTSKKAETAKKQLPSRLDGYKDCINFEIQESQLLTWIKTQYLASYALKEETIALGVVKRAIMRCLEGVTAVDFDPRTEDLVLTMDIGGTQVFRNLSDGQRIMLTLVGDLARRATTLNPQLGNRVLDEISGVVSIDELDLHLHPKWQRRVIRDLKGTFPSLQFIATSHSPQLIGEALPHEIIILGAANSTNPSQSFGMDSNWVLKHIMGAEERDNRIRAAIESIERHIAAGNLKLAASDLAKVRSEIGNDPNFVRFGARIDRFERARQ